MSPVMQKSTKVSMNEDTRFGRFLQLMFSSSIDSLKLINNYYCFFFWLERIVVIGWRIYISK